MSVKVDLNQLAAKLTDYTFAYLVTVDDNYHAHTVAVEPQLVDGVIDVGPVGGHTRRNLASHDGVTLIWPPRRPGGFSLIVDGRGQPAATDDDTQQIVPSRAVLHRKRSRHSANPGTNDCVVLSEN
ncbi:pyridoxamine 5'-phosphate oxidase family protein [Mycolicibacterium wolinskyi]|uniref:pyridoxamine 5'-phosphate oxidase family protein n=1 Tax=Mycolicibacterium wolinskyi TaxID=59750 RepID=UPI003917A52A